VTVNGVTTSYRLSGDRVTFKQRGSDTLYYVYDSQGQLISMIFNDVEYGTIRNVQHDIIGLINNGEVHMIQILNETLNSARLEDYGRSCDLLWFSFVKDSYEIVINCQCFVRVVENNKIVATSKEIYTPKRDEDDEFNWEVFKDSVYDTNLKDFMKDNKDRFIEQFVCLGNNDYVILLNNGLQIQMLDDISNDDELWRIIYNKKHYVCRNEITEE
jgi:YD repeat-containing protein